MHFSEKKFEILEDKHEIRKIDKMVKQVFIAHNIYKGVLNWIVVHHFGIRGIEKMSPWY